MPSSRTVAEYHDFLVYVSVYASDEFPTEDYLALHEQMNLDKAFAKLIDDLPAISPRVKDQGKMLVLRELLLMSQEAYRQSNNIRGAHILQEFEGFVWPKYKRPTTFLAEAQQRLASS